MSTSNTPPSPSASPASLLARWNAARLRLAETQRGTIAEWTVTILLLLFATTSLVQAFVIPTGSMEDTLLIGDHLLVDKLTYSPKGPLSKFLLPYQDVQRGDIIVFRYPEDIRQTFVKRAIGVPGDRIRVVNKQLMLNGKPVQEPYKYHKTDYFDSYRDNFPSEPNMRVYPGAEEMLNKHVRRYSANGEEISEVVVPPNSIFAMGDNRDSSLDSRYWGFVSRENIIGKPLIIYWSYESSTDRLAGSPINPEHLQDLALNFFSKTRWSRTFQLIRGYPLQ
ncbi:MAG: signal peptidase I [Bryobacter sp.]|nr:signal peptidase I [Bryobacter sp. CoA8 C33]